MPPSSGQDFNYSLISWYTRLVANRKANKNSVPGKMAPPFSSCLGFVFLTGHPDEDIFFSLSLSFKTQHQVLWKCPRSSISAIFSNFQSAFPGIILFNLSNNGGHREHTNLRPHLQMRKLKLKEAEMLSQDCCTSPRCRTGTCRQELVGRGHPHPPYENGLPGRALCRKKPTAPSSLCNWKRVLD